MIGRVRGIALGATLAAVVSASRAGHADEKEFSLDYQAGDAALGCPSETSFRRKVQGRLGYDPFSSAAGPQLRVRYRIAGGALVAETSWSGDAPGASRSFQGKRDHCEDLAEAVAAATAIAIDPLKSLAPKPEEPPPPVVAPAPPPEARPSAPEQPTRPKPAPTAPANEASGPRMFSRLALSLGVAFGRVPGAAIAPQISADFLPGPVFLRASAKVSLAVSSESIEGGTLRVTQLGIPLGACVALSITHTCLLAEGALALAELGGETKTALGLLFALRAEADVVEQGPLRIFPFIEGSAAAVRARVRRGDEVLWEESLPSFVAGAGVAYAWDGR